MKLHVYFGKSKNMDSYLQICSHLKENFIICTARHPETTVCGVALQKTSSRNTQGTVISKGASEGVHIVKSLVSGVQ